MINSKFTILTFYQFKQITDLLTIKSRISDFCKFNKIKGTINIKLDDEDFEATNTGVWSTTIESIKVPNNYTGWDDYKKDKPV